MHLAQPGVHLPDQRLPGGDLHAEAAEVGGDEGECASREDADGGRGELYVSGRFTAPSTTRHSLDFGSVRIAPSRSKDTQMADRMISKKIEYHVTFGQS